jgi:tetratricopeptide (TPR) repeat protein
MIIRNNDRGGIFLILHKKERNMRQVRTATNLVLALGLCLVMALPALAQLTTPGFGAGPFPVEIYRPLNEGFDFLNQGKYDMAAVKFQKVLQTDMNNPFALNNLAAIQEQQGHYREAMAFLKQGLTNADYYKQKVVQTCFVAGLCTAAKPSKEMGPNSTIAPIIRDNIAKLQPKIDALPPQPSSPPPMK